MRRAQIRRRAFEPRSGVVSCDESLNGSFLFLMRKANCALFCNCKVKLLCGIGKLRK